MPGLGMVHRHQAGIREQKIDRLARRQFAIHPVGLDATGQLRGKQDLLARLPGKTLERLLRRVRRRTV